MTIWEFVLDQIKNNFFQFVSEGHAFIINHVLQSFFFMLAIFQIATWALRKSNLFCAKEIKKSLPIKVIAFFIFLYFKWNDLSVYLQIVGYYCSIVISFHLYSFCIRMGTKITNLKKDAYGNISISFSVLLIYMSYKVFSLSTLQSESMEKYPYIAIYFFLLISILLIGLIRNQLIYSLSIMILISSIIMFRFWSVQLLKVTFLYKTSIPLESIFYLVFATQQNYLQNKEQLVLQRLKGEVSLSEQNNKARPCQLFKSQVYYYIFFLISKRMYSIELVFASICLISYICKRKHEC